MTEPIITSAGNKELEVNDDDRNGRKFDCEGFLCNAECDVERENLF